MAETRKASNQPRPEAGIVITQPPRWVQIGPSPGEQRASPGPRLGSEFTRKLKRVCALGLMQNQRLSTGLASSNFYNVCLSSPPLHRSRHMPRAVASPRLMVYIILHPSKARLHQGGLHVSSASRRTHYVGNRTAKSVACFFSFGRQTCESTI